ncbi:PQQ-binding-like beta-propeller repeat protein [Treponema lecithinolyticum]|uniref:outer membrane protein assembly factor BamB family protein n=1 Tax=Treponema lecithinolyticum TaxID=53418 RepID=UPI0028EF0C01|nr:PQQ-binding-like beta-propeller repeat protein [Treponema lecithinolyticum]
MKSIIKTVFLLLCTCACAAFVYAAEPAAGSQNETGQNAWQAVLGGEAVSAPKRTSYGFVAVSEGRILTACTGSGTVIWRRRLQDMPSKWFSVTDQNFVYAVSSAGKKLSLYSPDGILLWQTVPKESIVSDPLQGRDGRVFVAGKNSVSCYGSNGKRKWITELPAGSGLPLTQMNDGSILYIPSFTKNGASTGIRISPYGEPIEEIVFTGKISAIASHSEGVILGFDTGTVGCAAVVNNTTETLWSLKTKDTSGTAQRIIPGKSGFCVLYSDSNLSEYSFNDRSVLWTKHDGQVKPSGDFFAAYDTGRYVFALSSANGTYTASYASQENERQKSGTLLWQKTVKSAGRFPLVTSSLYLVLCDKNWVISAYSLENDTEEKSADFLPKPLMLRYGSYANTKTAQAEKKAQEDKKIKKASLADIAQTLSAGDYGTKENVYKKRIVSILNDYKEQYGSSERYFSNIAEKTAVLTLVGLLESTEFNYVVPLILQNEKDPALAAAAFRCAAALGNDPDGQMLEAVERLYHRKKTTLSPAVLGELGEAVYYICRYMGRPAFTKRGKAILADMLLPGNDSTVQTRAREIMLRFIELETPVS